MISASDALDTPREGNRRFVVLGHSSCGAVTAALKKLALEQTHRLSNLRAIVHRVRPAIEPVFEINENSDEQTLTAAAVRANIRAAAARLADTRATHRFRRTHDCRRRIFDRGW